MDQGRHAHFRKSLVKMEKTTPHAEWRMGRRVGDSRGRRGGWDCPDGDRKYGRGCGGDDLGDVGCMFSAERTQSLTAAKETD